VDTWVLMMDGMVLGEERHHFLPPHFGLVPHGLWRPPPCPRGIDVSHVWPIMMYFFIYYIL
jgi:hypothetical protein